MDMATDIMAMGMEIITMDINKSNMKIKTYVINLKDSTVRRKAVLAETAKYPIMDVELVEAVDGRNMKPEEIEKCFNIQKFINRYYRAPKGGEIGCTLSHRKCYRKLLDSNEEFALILEDDVHFMYPEDVNTILEEILNKIQCSEPYFITFTMHFIYHPKKCRRIGKYVFHEIYNAYGTCAYLINRNAARCLLSESYPFTVADDYPFIRGKEIIVEGIYPTFAVSASTNMIQTEIQDEEKVFIRKSLLQYLKLYCGVLHRKVLRLFGKLSYRPYKNGINF